MNTRAKAIRKLTSKRLLQFFLQGMLILAPIAITCYLLYWLFDKVDSILRPYLNIPGLGFAVILVFVLLVGWASSNLFMGSILNVFDSFLERTPGVKFIYSTFKDFFEAFAGEKRKFNRPVLASIDDTDIWRMGFITQEDLSEWGLKDFAAVYVPMAYSIAGNVYLVPASRIRPVTNLNATDAMKFAISGGVTAVDDEKG
ncbi:MAG TPA: DUF502 domain-containing protein [Chitinophagaceae bacterium]|nr:DUF502 domain-containing protein [Chitinophagaceae bacterium]